MNTDGIYVLMHPEDVWLQALREQCPEVKLPVMNEYYTIRALDDATFTEPMVWLNEIINPVERYEFRYLDGRPIRKEMEMPFPLRIFSEVECNVDVNALIEETQLELAD